MLDHDGGPDLEERLLALVGAFLVLGAFAGATVTALTLRPAGALAAPPELLRAALLALTVSTGGLAATGLAYLARRALQGRLDRRVGRALPIAFFFAGALVAPWARLALAAPHLTAVAGAVGITVGLILAESVRYALLGSNRIARVFAVLNVWQYGVLAAGLLLVASARRPEVPQVEPAAHLTDQSTCRASAR